MLTLMHQRARGHVIGEIISRPTVRMYPDERTKHALYYVGKNEECLA